MARRVFFSFHYQPDLYRVNVIRNSPLTHDLDSSDSFFDGALWEKAKSTSTQSLQQLIREGMKGCSVVCVLAGAMTWSRPWVRYEIARAIIEGKGVVTVHIGGILCMKSQQTSARGQNPLAFMGVGRPNSDNKYYLCENFNGSWRWYPDYTLAVAPPAFLPLIGPGKLLPLSNGTREYDYALQNGYSNLPGWIEDAALAVGR
jgi:hypothetical protein